MVKFYAQMGGIAFLLFVDKLANILIPFPGTIVLAWFQQVLV